jgi:hypothetical protein
MAFDLQFLSYHGAAPGTLAALAGQRRSVGYGYVRRVPVRIEPAAEPVGGGIRLLAALGWRRRISRPVPRAPG